MRRKSGSLVAASKAMRMIGETLVALACVGMVWIIFVGRLLHVGPVY